MKHSKVSALAFLAAFRLAARRLEAKGIHVGLASYVKIAPDQHQVGVIINSSDGSRTARLSIPTTACPMPGQAIEPMAYYNAVAQHIEERMTSS